MSEVAVEYGWLELTLIPKCGGEPIRARTRYIDFWKKDKAGKAMLIDNADVPDQRDVAPAA